MAPLSPPRDLASNAGALRCRSKLKSDVEMILKTDFVGEEKIIRPVGGRINTSSMVQHGISEKWLH